MKKLYVNKEQLENYLNQGKSILEIAELFNCSENTIRRRISEYNISYNYVKPKGNTNRRYTISLEYLKSQISKYPDDWDYILGLMITDGNICKNMIRISDISDKNIDMLISFNNFFDNKLTIHRNFRKQQKKYYNTICFKNIDIVEFLKNEYKLTPNKTFTIEAPYINWNVLRGIFDGDGCIHKENKGINCYKFIITSASDKLIIQIVNFLNEYNIKSSVYDRGTYKDIVVCSKNYLQIIFDNFYKNSHYFIKRKYNVWCPSFEKSNEQNLVNSVKGERTHQTEPSHNLKGAETLN